MNNSHNYYNYNSYSYSMIDKYRELATGCKIDLHNYTSLSSTTHLGSKWSIVAMLMYGNLITFLSFLLSFHSITIYITSEWSCSSLDSAYSHRLI